MKSTSEKLQEIEKFGYPLDMEAVFKQAFDNYRKVTLTIGTLLLVLILLFTVLGGATAVYLGFKDFTELVTNIDISNFSLLAIAVEFVITIIGTALMAPLSAGLLKMAHDAFRGEAFGFSTAFYYYKSDYFKDLFTAAVIISVFTSGVVAMLNLVMEYNDIEGLNSFINFFIGIFNGLANLLTLFTIPLIIFGDLSAKEAIKGSITTVLKRFWPILGLVLLGAFCAITFGLMALCIGVFYTLPFMYSLQYTIYRNVFEIEEANETPTVES